MKECEDSPVFLGPWPLGCGENFKMANFMYGYIFFIVLGGVQYGKFFVF